MTDEKKTEEPGKLTVGDLRKWMKEEIGTLAEALAGKGKPEEKTGGDGKTETRTGSVAEEVRAELAKLEARRKGEERTKTIEDQLAKLTEAAQPKPPVERRHPTLHRIMGWGDNG